MTYICYPTSFTPDPTVAPVLNGGTFISKVPDNKTAQDEVAGMGLELNQVAIFENNDFTTSELYFVQCFNIESDNTVTFDLDKAKADCKTALIVPTLLKNGHQNNICLFIFYKFRLISFIIRLALIL